MNTRFCIARHANGSVLIGTPSAQFFIEVKQDELKELAHILIGFSHSQSNEISISIPDPYRVDPDSAQSLVRTLLAGANTSEADIAPAVAKQEGAA